MSGLRNYSAGTRTALVTLSRGACYAPVCGEPVIKIIEGEYYNNYWIAHIRGAQEGGARHDPSMSEAERKAFTNLLLLCRSHHECVDIRHPDKYSPEILLKWKSDREADKQDAFAGLTRMTEDVLEAILIEAFQAKQNQMIEILERLETNDAEAANLLKEMLEELGRFREYSTLLDPDSATKLYHAATYLADLNLARSASELTLAASGLESLPGTVAHLEHLINRLDGMEGRWG
jgi:hypothetical protein